MALGQRVKVSFLILRWRRRRISCPAGQWEIIYCGKYIGIAVFSWHGLFIARTKGEDKVFT